MNWIRPFSLIAPPANKSHLVASRSYVTYSKGELRDKLERNPYSYLHVINPTGNGSKEVKRGTVPFFKKVKERYNDFKDKGWLLEHEGDRLVVYRQSTEQHTCTGIVAGLSIESIRAGKLKLHEQTLKRREQLFAKYLETVECNAEPVLCAFDDMSTTTADEVKRRIKTVAEQRPDMDFTTTDRIRHTLWILTNAESLALSDKVQGLSPLYLADGHHRVASSLILEEMESNKKGDATLMAYIIPESDLIIKGYHRGLKEVNWTSEEWEDALDKLSDSVDYVRLNRKDLAAPSRVGIIHLHTAECTWKITLKASSVDLVDAQILQTSVFEAVFGINDARNDPRLTYIPGTQNTSELLQQLSGQTNRVVFEMHPISTAQIKATADRSGFLPPKSSWIEPKLRSGLFIHEI